MTQIAAESHALPRIAQERAERQRRYEASPAEAAPDVSGYIEGVTAIIVPPRGTTYAAERSTQ